MGRVHLHALRCWEIFIELWIVYEGLMSRYSFGEKKSLLLEFREQQNLRSVTQKEFCASHGLGTSMFCKRLANNDDIMQTADSRLNREV